MDAVERLTTAIAMALPEKQASTVEELIGEHGRMVYRVAYAMLRDHHDAEDVAQEVFVRVWRHKAEIPELRDRKAWLARVAWRAAVDHSKRRRRRPDNVSFDSDAEYLRRAAAAGASAEQLASSREMARMVESLVAALPMDLREALELSALDELTSEEMAAVLQTSSVNARNRVFRARQMLRARLAALLEKGSRP